MNKQVPARLHVLLARHSPMAVVIRRGPSKQVCTVGWNREDDSFEVGQWLKGRIYEYRCDLSPDGKYLLYFAMKGGETYTAISRAPWLKAVEFYPMIGTWEGGGLFLTENKFWLNEHFQRGKPLIHSVDLQRDESDDPGGFYGEGRLIRNGWKPSEDTSPSDVSSVFEKPLPEGWILTLYKNRYELINKESDSLLECDDWEWADLDGQTVVWASKGCIYRASIESSEKIGVPKILYDFNPLKFERIEAPY